MYELSSLARKRAVRACSTASPKRPMGTWTSRRSRFSWVSRKFMSRAVGALPLTNGKVASSAHAFGGVHWTVISVCAGGGGRHARAEGVDANAFAGVYRRQFTRHRQYCAL
jgi:hypothetical protein